MLKTKVLVLLFALFAFKGFSQISEIQASVGNPYDHIGKAHNEGLDFIMTNYPTITKEYYDENWIGIMSDFLSSKDQEPSYFVKCHQNDKATQIFGRQSWYQDNTAIDEATKFHANGQMTSDLLSKINEIHAILKTTDSLILENNGDGAVVFSILSNDLIKLESSYQSMSGEDAKICYMVNSISRYSLHYWLNQGSKEVSEWNVPKTNSGGYLFKFRWGQMGAADAGGAVAGAVRSGVLALFGPVGWGAVGASTLASGIGASAGNAIYQLFN